MSTHDPQDYDGMGNFGRFPPETEPKPHAGDQARVPVIMVTLFLLLVMLWLTSCNHVTAAKPEEEHNGTLQEFFYPAPPGVDYHPMWNRPPPFWPPHEHMAPLDKDHPFPPALPVVLTRTRG